MKYPLAKKGSFCYDLLKLVVYIPRWCIEYRVLTQYYFHVTLECSCAYSVVRCVYCNSQCQIFTSTLSFLISSISTCRFFITFINACSDSHSGSKCTGGFSIFSTPSKMSNPHVRPLSRKYHFLTEGHLPCVNRADSRFVCSKTKHSEIKQY